jgi:hypothetical protein
MLLHVLLRVGRSPCKKIDNKLLKQLKQYFIMNYYYDLPNEIIEYINTFNRRKVLANIINNPPKNIKDMLKPVIPNKRYYRDFYNKTSEIINYENRKIILYNKNFIKFCIEFNIKTQKNKISSRKAFKYKLIKTIKDGYNLKETIPCSDHERIYITYDNKYIIVSTPYGDGTSTDKDHFKYNFKKYRNSLYYTPGLQCTSYYLVLE